MTITVKSFSKINLGLAIGALRGDGFHELRTVYQTIALHDRLSVSIIRGSGIEIRCADPRVPKDRSNTCYRMVERAMNALKGRGRVVIEIEKRLPVQGGLGGGSGNAVAALLALEIALEKKLPGTERLHIAADVGSDLPLFLIGGTVLGVGRGEEVYPLPEVPSMHCVVATPEIGVSTPKAFADWDALHEGKHFADMSVRATRSRPLTSAAASDRLSEFGYRVASWLSGAFPTKVKTSKVRSRKSLSGVPVSKGRGRAETLLLDLVRTGIENDFEQVVFPKNPALRDVKNVLQRSGAIYASLSGSGSALYGIFGSRDAAAKAAQRLRKSGVPAVVTTTLTRQQYWRKLRVSDH